MCFILGLSYYAGEIVVSLLVGPLSELLQTTTTTVAIATVFGGIGIAVSLLVKNPKMHKENQEPMMEKPE